jgi:hypothetical protein
MTNLQVVVGFIPLVLLVVLLVVLASRRVYKTFPFFFSYVTFAVMADVARFLTHQSEQAFFVTYWATEAGYSLLGVSVLYEIYRSVFRQLTSLWWIQLAFPSAVAVAGVLVAARSYFYRSTMPNFLMTFIVSAELGVRLLQVSLFILLVLLVYFFGLRWRHQAFGIALGFGLYATIALASTTKFYDFGTNFAFTWGAILVVSYSVSVVIWIWFFSRRDAVGPSRDEQEFPPISLQDLERYKQAARRILKR